MIRFALGTAAAVTASLFALASPASAEEPPPAPPALAPTVPAGHTAARVHFDATEPGVEFHVRPADAHAVGWVSRDDLGTIAHGWSHVCIAPCDATVVVGTHRFAVTKDGAGPLELPPAYIQGPSKVTATYASRKGLRIAGWTIIGGSAALGALFLFEGLSKFCVPTTTSSSCGDGSTDRGFTIAGSVFLAAGALLGIPLVLQHDDATVTVTPLDAGRLLAPPAREGSALAASSAPGLGVVARF